MADILHLWELHQRCTCCKPAPCLTWDVGRKQSKKNKQRDRVDRIPQLKENPLHKNTLSSGSLFANVEQRSAHHETLEADVFISGLRIGECHCSASLACAVMMCLWMENTLSFAFAAEQGGWAYWICVGKQMKEKLVWTSKTNPEALCPLCKTQQWWEGQGMTNRDYAIANCVAVKYVGFPPIFMCN